MRILLVLGRVSNLPTVWSNCLAAWLLGGGGSWDRFALLCLGATFLYTGGMFLNDAVDEAFDRHYRPERPIVSGRISARTVWVLSFIWLAAGWVTFLLFGKSVTLMASFLLLTIVLYDAVHKRTDLAPLLMAACRFLLYLVAASAARGGSSPSLIWAAAALASYIIGLSFLARRESAGERRMHWAVGLLLVPTVVALIRPNVNKMFLVAIVLLQAVWMLWCLASRKREVTSAVPAGVAGLLAGIVLVDWLAAVGHGFAAGFLCLFLLALLLQRVAPAT